MRRVRVLVCASEKAGAEVVTRGLAAIARPEVEIDVALQPDLACRQLADCNYDVLLVTGVTEFGQVPGLVEAAPKGLPVVLVGGPPGEAMPSNGVFRVPLPFSYTLLRQALHRALGLVDAVRESADLRRRDQAG